MIFLLLSLLAYSAPLLDNGFSISIDPEKKNGLAKLIVLKEFELFQNVDTEILDDQKVKTNTKQRFKAKWLPENKKQESALSVKFLEFQLFSKMHVPGFGAFENKQDLVKQMKNQELIYTWIKDEIVSVKGVSALREKILDSSKDPIEKATLGRLLQEDLMKNNGNMFRQDAYCLNGIDKKVPGDQWNSVLKNLDSKINLQCKFLGWGEWKKKSVAKIEVTIPSQKNEISSSSGKKQTMEIEGTGEIFLLLDTGETFIRIKQKVRVTSEKGSINQSDVLAESHFYP
jgi:hypothetical protein